MSEPIALVTDAALGYDEYLDFLREYGALMHPDEVFEGQLVRGDKNVWIAYDGELGELGPEDIIEIMRVLVASRGRWTLESRSVAI